MAIALVANTGAGSTDTNNVTTGSIDTTGANLIVLSVSTYAGSFTVSDSKGNTWTALTNRGGGTNTVRLYYCVAPTVGSGHTFSATGASGAAPTICVVALSGAAASPYDQESGSGASLSPGSITPAEDNEIFVTAHTFYPSQTVTIGSGFTISNQVNYVGGQHMGGAMAYKIQTSTGAENPTWGSSPSEAQVSAMATFKAAAVAAGHPAIKRMGGVTFAANPWRHVQGGRAW